MNKIKPFRLKHKESGLYYMPVRRISVKCPDGKKRYLKSNLSKKGKVYFTDPRKHIFSISDHNKIIEDNRYRGPSVNFKSECVGVTPEDFEIEYIYNECI